MDAKGVLGVDCRSAGFRFIPCRRNPVTTSRAGRRAWLAFGAACVCCFPCTARQTEISWVESAIVLLLFALAVKTKENAISLREF